MKRIALAIENFSRYGGGAESYAVNLAETLVRDGWEVHCFGEQWGGEPASAIFHRITVPRFWPSWLRMLLFAMQHKRMVQKEHFDVVLGFGNTILMNVYQSHGGVHWYSARRKTYTESNSFLRWCKKILMFLSLKHHARHWIESAPFRQKKLPRIIAISDMLKRDMAAFYKISPEMIDLVYNGIDTEKFDRARLREYRQPVRKRYGIPETAVVFLFVSYELEKKGIEPLVKAAGLLKKKQQEFRVLVVGAQPYAGLSKLMKKYGLEKTVIFTGPVKSVQEMYGAGDVFILPTFYDACSLVVLEAMVCGLPPITTVTNGIAGILTDGENGCLLAHPPRPVQTAGKMELLLNKDIRKKMAAAALNLGVHYTERKNHQAMLKILNEALIIPGDVSG